MTSKVTKYFRKQKKRFVGWAKKRYTGKGALKNIISDVSMLKTALNVEVKYHDRQDTAAAIAVDASTPRHYSVFDGILEGTGPATRIGDQVKMLRTTCRINTECIATGDLVSHHVRIMAILDKEPQADGTIINATDLRYACLQHLELDQSQILSGYNTLVSAQMGDRFKVLKDITYSLDNVQRKNRIIDFTLDWTKLFPKKKGLLTKYYKDEGNTVGRANNHKLYVLVMSDAPTAGGQVYMVSAFRTSYVDN